MANPPSHQGCATYCALSFERPNADPIQGSFTACNTACYHLLHPDLGKCLRCIELFLQVKSRHHFPKRYKWRLRPVPPGPPCATLNSSQRVVAHAIIPGMKAPSLCAPHRRNFPNSVSASERNTLMSATPEALFIPHSAAVFHWGGETALGNEGLRGSIVSFSDVAHHLLPFAYIPHSGSGGMETATPPAPAAGQRRTGDRSQQILGGERLRTGRRVECAFAWGR